MFLTDAVAMRDSENPLMAADLCLEQGRTLRLPTHWYADVAVILSIANT